MRSIGTARDTGTSLGSRATTTSPGTAPRGGPRTPPARARARAADTTAAATAVTAAAAACRSPTAGAAEAGPGGTAAVPRGTGRLRGDRPKTRSRDTPAATPRHPLTIKVNRQEEISTHSKIFLFTTTRHYQIISINWFF